METSFVKPWTNLLGPDEPVTSLIPTLDVIFTTGNGSLRVETFLVDSGADISMASRQLCEEIGLEWEAGSPIKLKGISPKPECDVAARIFEVETFVPDIGVAFDLPICFADGDTSQLLGREGFFDCFRVAFDKQRLETRFDLIEDVEAYDKP